MLGVPGMGDRSIPLEILGASPGSDAYDDPEAFLTGVAAERITILRILHAARLPLPDSALNALAGIDERRLLAGEPVGVSTRRSLPQDPAPPVADQAGAQVPCPNVFPACLTECHQSLQAQVVGGHQDTMGTSAPESKVALAQGGGARIPASLQPSGTVQPLPISSCHFPKFGFATLISAPGREPEDLDVEVSDATSIPLALHASRDPTLLPHEAAAVEGPPCRLSFSRGAYVRSQNRIYLDGAALCDHPQTGADARGSLGWFARMMARPDVGTHRRARAVLALRPGGYNAWRRLNPAQQNALAALQ